MNGEWLVLYHPTSLRSRSAKSTSAEIGRFTSRKYSRWFIAVVSTGSYTSHNLESFDTHKSVAAVRGWIANALVQPLRNKFQPFGDRFLPVVVVRRKRDPLPTRRLADGSHRSSPRHAPVWRTFPAKTTIAGSSSAGCRRPRHGGHRRRFRKGDQSRYGDR